MGGQDGANLLCARDTDRERGQVGERWKRAQKVRREDAHAMEDSRNGAMRADAKRIFGMHPVLLTSGSGAGRIPSESCSSEISALAILNSQDIHTTHTHTRDK